MSAKVKQRTSSESDKDAKKMLQIKKTFQSLNGLPIDGKNKLSI